MIVSVPDWTKTISPVAVLKNVTFVPKIGDVPVLTMVEPVATREPRGQAATPLSRTCASEARQRGSALVSKRVPGAKRKTMRLTSLGLDAFSPGSVQVMCVSKPVPAPGARKP